MSTWPTSLPSQFEIGAELTQQDGSISSPTDTGPLKRRRRFTAVSRFYSGTMLLTRTQYSTLKSFYATTVGQGADAFDFEDPEDFGTVLARFLGPPSFSALVGGPSGVELWRASFGLELLP